MIEVLRSSILTIVIFLPLVGAAVVCLLPPAAHGAIRRNALTASVFTLIFAFLAVGLFFEEAGDPSANGAFALEVNVPWIGGEDFPIHTLDIRYHLGIDGVSLWLLMLTAVLTPLAIWASFSGIQDRVKEYYALMLALETGMLGVFCSMDLLLFYVFFEFTLVPLFFIIGIWGGPEKRRAANKFFIYTVAGSVLTFAGILYIAYFAYQYSDPKRFTFDLQALYSLAERGLLPRDVQWWLFLAFAAGFAIKVPLFPLHTWLPLAHTEAPTAGSVILAGILLKLGTYGFLRFSVPMLPDAARHFAPAVAVIAIAGIIYAALVAWVQDDVKKLVAYSSVSHLGFCMLGMFSLNLAGLTGSLLYMVNHGLSTGALFLVVGVIYERYHTRQISEIGGLGRRMPWMAFFLILFTLSSVGLPGLNGFVGEFLVLLGAFTSRGHEGHLGIAYAAVAATGVILSALYMLWMCQRVLFGPLKEPEGTPDTSHGLTHDLTGREIGVLAPIGLLCVLIGVWPKPFLTVMQPALDRQVLERVLPTGQAWQARSEDSDATPAFGLPRGARAPNDEKTLTDQSMQKKPRNRSEPATEATGTDAPHRRLVLGLPPYLHARSCGLANESAVRSLKTCRNPRTAAK